MTSDFVFGVVEGPVDEAILTRVLQGVGREPEAIYVQGGKSNLLRNLAGYNNAARIGPWVVIVDLDRDHECAPPAKEEWLPSAEKYMCFRIAVRAAEAWLMADRSGFAQFLGVPLAKVPAYPEQLEDPKKTVVDLARKSKKSYIREELVPEVGSGRKIGHLYPSRLMDFATTAWNPQEAAARSDSLARCMRRLVDLVGGS